MSGPWDEEYDEMAGRYPSKDAYADDRDVGGGRQVPTTLPFEDFEPFDPATLPRREFIYGRHYIRQFVSVTVAPGGLGKSTLVLAECIAIATGRALLGVTPASRQRVAYFNAEDPKVEIKRRIAAMCQCHGIDMAELRGWLRIASGRDTELILAAGEQGEIVEPVFALMDAWAQEWRPAVIAFDPLANMTESPETNDVFRRLGKRLSRFADAHNLSIEVVHHTRKLNGREAEIEDSRGGGALVGAVRAGRVLNPMTPGEAAKAGLKTHIDHFRIEAAGKNNLARPSPRAEWFERIDVALANGDDVAAVRRWEWPDAFEDVSVEDARRVQLAIEALADQPPSLSHQAKDWAGYVVARTLDLDPEEPADKSRILLMLKAWIKSGALEVEEVRNTRRGTNVKVVVVGSTILGEEVSS